MERIADPMDEVLMSGIEEIQDLEEHQVKWCPYGNNAE